MRILFVITQSEQGGAQRYVADLAGALFSRGHDVFVAAGSRSHHSDAMVGAGWLFEELRHDSFGFTEDRLIRLKHLRRAIHPLLDILAYFELRRLIRKLRPDIVHLNSSKAGILGSYAARGTRRVHPKVVYTAHGFVFSERISRPLRALYRFLERRASGWRDLIITVSEHDRRDALDHHIAPAEKIRAIHNGLDLELAQKLLPREEAVRDIRKFIEAKSALLLPPNARFVGAIANLYPTKGIDYFLAAAARLIAAPTQGSGQAPKYPDLYFVVFGEGKARRPLERFINTLGLEKRFFLLGAVPKAFRYIRGFDVFCLSSTKEGFPYSLLEARLANVPIVATRVGGVSEIVDEKSGILVPSEDPVALAEGIEAALRRESAQGPYPKEFSLPRMVDETLALYERLINE